MDPAALASVSPSKGKPPLSVERVPFSLEFDDFELLRDAAVSWDASGVLHILRRFGILPHDLDAVGIEHRLRAGLSFS